MTLHRIRTFSWFAAALVAVFFMPARAGAQTTSGQAGQTGDPKFPSSKISGLMFGDYYWFAQSHRDELSSTDPTPVRELQGLWFRRLYLTYDYNYNERLTTRFRLEANSNGDFTGGDIVPYVKDAYL